MKEKKKHFSVLLLSLFFLIITFLLSIALGSVYFSLSELWGGISFKEGYETQSIILFSVRLPRSLGAILSGAALSASGLLLQTATGNDLCAPNIIGVNSGAGLFVIIGLTFAPTAFFLLPISAFCGAIFATFFVLLISSFSKEKRSSLILAGVAVSSFFNAGISFFTFAFPDVLTSYSSFTSGSLSDVYIKDIILPAIIILICIILSFMIYPSLRILCLGDKLAHSLGINVKLIRVLALIIASGLCASSVSFAGLIGFAGLIVPHISRRLTSADSKFLLPVTIIHGSTLILISDMLGRTLFSPSELPCGIIMSLAGAPFFVFLLCKRRKRDA